MFGLGDMTGMIKEVAEFKALFERFVVATEENSSKLDSLLAHAEKKADESLDKFLAEVRIKGN